MNGEIEKIKEILEDVKRHLDYVEVTKQSSIRDNEMKAMYNYITNLQEENQKLKEQLNCKEYFSSTMPEDTEFVILTKNNYDRQQKDLALENIELKEENEKLNKIIDELEKWLKETKKFNYGFKIKSEYIYAYEFVCKNILNKLTKLKKEAEQNE